MSKKAALKYLNERECSGCGRAKDSDELTHVGNGTAICDSCRAADVDARVAKAEKAVNQVVPNLSLDRPVSSHSSKTAAKDPFITKPASDDNARLETVERRLESMEGTQLQILNDVTDKLKVMTESVKDLREQLFSQSRLLSAMQIPPARVNMACKICDLNIQEYPYCSASGRIHVLKQELEQDAEAPKTSMFFNHPELYQWDKKLQGRISTVLFFVAFGSVLPAPADTIAEATNWLQFMQRKLVDDDWKLIRDNMAESEASSMLSWRTRRYLKSFT
ncbi:hypothetical protein DIPPA_20231 [Diplonema papillatum]|nr:hypothetical protein DIPPA_20231 [Diplonema papillatum]